MVSASAPFLNNVCVIKIYKIELTFVSFYFFSLSFLEVLNAILEAKDLLLDWKSASHVMKDSTRIYSEKTNVLSVLKASTQRNQVLWTVRFVQSELISPRQTQQNAMRVGKDSIKMNLENHGAKIVLREKP